MAALETVATTLRDALPPADARTVDERERRVRLLIEFRADSRATEVVIGSYEPRDETSPFDAIAARALATVPVGREYALANMRLILADAFHLPEADLARLGPLGPLAGP